MRLTCGLLALIAAACGGPLEPQDEDGVARGTQALANAKFSGWSQVPGGPLFSNSPFITTKTSVDYKEKNIFAVGLDQKLYLDVWVQHGAAAPTWTGWSPIAAPAGVGFTSSPVATPAWTINLGETQNARGARAHAAAPCPKCVYLQVGNGQARTWHAVSNSGNGVGDVSLVYSQPYLYLFQAVALAGGERKVVYSRNTVFPNGYNNNNWSAFTEVPGGGRFHYSPTAVAKPNGVILLGMGIDDRLYATSIHLSTWDGFYWVEWSAGIFTSSPGAVYVDGWGKALFGRGLDNKMWQGSVNAAGAWDGWHQLPTGPATFNSGANAWAWGAGHVDLVARGNDNRIWINTYQQ